MCIRDRSTHPVLRQIFLYGKLEIFFYNLTMSDGAQRAESNLRINRTGTAATAATTAMIA